MHHLKLWTRRLRTAHLWIYEFLRSAVSPFNAKFTCMSLVMGRSKSLSVALGSRPLFYSRLLPLKGDVVVGWGRKWSGQRAERIAAEYNRPLQLIEDGFLCSVDRLDMCLSYLIDTVGVHYDATQESELENFVKVNLNNADLFRGRRVARKWRSNRLSKYNGAHEYDGNLYGPYVLVIDQTLGDKSISYGLANAESFQLMLDAALIEYPCHKILLKTHPDVMTRAKYGHFDISALQSDDRICVILDPVHPVRLIEHADAVYTVTSQVGFEALIWGKRVRTFGMPFYAGWGLTEDELPSPDRRKRVTLDQLVHGALVKYPRYVDPLTMQLCDVERAMKYVGLQRYKRLEFPQHIIALGFSRWKRPFVKLFLQGSEISFSKKIDTCPEFNADGAIAVWGSVEVPGIGDGTKVLRIEDGFLRSSGLGADLARPLSLVVDDVGIYYDSTRASRLEQIFSEQILTEDQAKRAQLLREEIIKLDVTKYNLGQSPWVRPESSERVLLVVGQVETDASIQLGSPIVTRNIALLCRVRAENPKAYIVYKPHPDVTAGLRRRGVQEDRAMQYADELLTSPVSIGSLVKSIDEMHTMTSLIGFEALIRGAKVVCYGLPFYAGWGLTEDTVKCSRRNKALKLDELVYGALISYPRYFNYEQNCFIDPEHAIAQLAILRETCPAVRSLHRKLFRAVIVAWLKLKGSKQ